jgi:hypothetical protein
MRRIVVLYIIKFFLDLPWGLPLGFPSIPPFGAFPPFGLPTTNFSPLNSFASSTTTGYPPPPLPPSLLSNDLTNPTTADVWSNGLSTTNTNIDYNEYTKQFGLLMNAFSEQPQSSEIDKSKSKKFIFIQTIYY